MVSEAMIRDLEMGRKLRSEAYVIRIQQSLENAGVTFLADGEETGGGPGVRLKGV
jgi:hypothetical protein